MMKAEGGGVDNSYTLFLTSALESGGWLTPPPANYPLARPGTHITGAWVGNMVDLDGCRE